MRLVLVVSASGIKFPLPRVGLIRVYFKFKYDSLPQGALVGVRVCSL